MSEAKGKPTIFAYGFDAAGFTVPSDPVETEKYVIRFIGYNANQSLEDADGIIIPSGIFETRKSSNSYMGSSSWMVCNSKDHLAKREKEVFQNFRRGGWTALLLREVDNGHGEWANTDLAKSFLNGFFWNVKCHDPNPHVRCKADEFADYLHDFGINRTTFGTPKEKNNPRVLAEDGGAMVAAELFGQFFFLPLPSVEKSRSTVTTLVMKCAAAILEYKRRNDLHLPHWVENIEFQTEKTLRDEITALEGQIIQRREDLSKWRRYKGILSASGKALSGVVVDLLRDYFKLDLHSKEEFIEDAIIYEGGKPLFVVEIKGVNAGLKRDHVNQVDSHRERLGISPEIPGLLIINDFSDIDGLAERKVKTFDTLHTAHAEKLNIKILRTIRLLEIVRALEPEKDRGARLIRLCSMAKPMVELPNIGNNPPPPPPNE
jgi:hypothetical protein